MVWKREGRWCTTGTTVHGPAARRPGHRARQAAEDDQPPGAADIPIFWASLMGKSVDRHGRARRRLAADLLRPRRSSSRCGATTSTPGSPERDPTLGPLQISAGGMVAIGDEYAGDGADARARLRPPELRAVRRWHGRPGQELLQHDLPRSTATSDEAIEIQDLYLAGKKEEAAAKVPRELLAGTQPRRAARSTSPSASPPTRRPASRTSRSMPADRRPGRHHRTAQRPHRLTVPHSLVRSAASAPTVSGETVRPCRGATTGRGARRRRAAEGDGGPAATCSSVTTSISSPRVSPSTSWIRS